jgi:hypothetical protein
LDYDRKLVDLCAITSRSFVLYVQPGRIRTGRTSIDGRQEDARSDELQSDHYRALCSHFAEVMSEGTIAALSSAPDRVGFLLADEWMGRPGNNHGDGLVAHHQLADTGASLAAELPLPTFDHDDRRLYERITLLGSQCRIKHVLYPALADRDAAQALVWCRLHR